MINIKIGFTLKTNSLSNNEKGSKRRDGILDTVGFWRNTPVLDNFNRVQWVFCEHGENRL